MFSRRCVAGEGHLLGRLGWGKEGLGFEIGVEIVVCLFEMLVIYIFLG